MAQKITIEFNSVFNKDPIINAAKDIKKAIDNSLSTTTVKDNAKKYAEEIGVITENIDKIKNKGFVNQDDLKSLDGYTKELEEKIKDLQEVLVKTSALPGKLEQELAGKLKKREEKYKKDVAGEAASLELNLSRDYGKKLSPNKAAAEKIALESRLSSLQESKKTAAPDQFAAIDSEIDDINKKLPILTGHLTTYETKVNNLTAAYNKSTASMKAHVDSEKQLATSEHKKKVDDLSEALKREAEALARLKLEGEAAKQQMAQTAAVQQGFGQVISEVQNKMKQLTSIAFLMSKAFQTVRKSVSAVSDLDKEMTEIGIVAKKTNEEMWQTFDTYNQLAYQLSSTTKQYLEGAKIFYQQGYEMAEVIKLVDATTKAATLSSVSFREASETLTAAIRAFNLEATEAASITDKYAAVGAYSAADFHELSVAMEKVASSAYTAGMSFDSTLGILAKGIETTKEAPEAIGTALKTIIARFQEMKVNPMADLGEGVDANRVEKALKTIGVAVRGTNGEFRDLDDVFNDLGAEWKNLSRNQKAYIATMAAGSRQQSRFMAIMNNYDRTLQLVRMSTNSAGEANRQYSIYQDSIDASQNRMRNSLEALYVSLTNSDAIKTFYNTMDALYQVITKLNPSVLITVTSLGALTYAILRAVVAFQSASTGGALLTLTNKLAEKSAVKAAVSFFGMGKSATVAARGVGTLGTTAGAAVTPLAALAATAAMVVAALVALVAIIVLITKAVQDHNNKVYEAAAAAREEASALNEEYQVLKGQTDRYEELGLIINKTTEEKEELKEITNQIVDQYPELLGGIDAEGNAYLKNSKALREYLLLKQQEAKKANLEASRKELATYAAKGTNWRSEVGEGGLSAGSVSAAKSVEEEVLNLRDEYGTIMTAVENRMWSTADFDVDSVKKMYEEAYQNAAQNYGIGSEYYKRLLKDSEKLLKAVENMQNQRSAAMKKIMSQTLFSKSSMDLDTLELEGKEISQEYRTLIASLTTEAVDVAAKLTDTQIQQTGLTITEKISKYSEGIYDGWVKELSKFQEDEAFQEALVKMTEAVEEGLSQKEITKLFEESFSKFKLPTEVYENVLDGFIDEDSTKERIDSIMRHIGSSMVNTTNDYGEVITRGLSGPQLRSDLTEAYSGMGDVLQRAVSIGVEGIADDDLLQDKFIGLIPKVFDNGEWQEDFNTELQNADLADPLTIANLTKKLEERLLTIDPSLGEGAKTIAEAMISQSTQRIENFLGGLKESYDKVKKISDDIKESANGALSAAQAQEMTQEYGVGSVLSTGTGYILSTEAAIEKQRVINNQLIADQLSTLEVIDEEIEAILTSTDGLTKIDIIRIEKLRSQKELMSNMVKSITDIDLMEQGLIDNQSVLNSVGYINSLSSSLKDMSSVYQKVQDGGMNLFDTLDAIGNNPQLIGALTRTNEGMRLSGSLMEGMAEQKKQETITFLETEKAKIDAAISAVDAMIEAEDINSANFSDSTKEKILALGSTEEAVITATNTENEALLSQGQSMQEIADADAERTQVFIDNTNARIQAINAEKRAAGDDILGGQVRVSARKANISISDSKKMLSNTDYMNMLANRYGLPTDDGLSKDLLNQLKKNLEDESKDIEGLINEVGNLSAQDMLEQISGTGKEEGGDSNFNKILGQFDQYYNLLKKIASLEEEMSQLDTRIGLESTGGAEDISLLKEKMTLLHQQAKVTEVLVDRQEQALALAREDMSKFGSFISFAEDELVVRWDLINAIEITSEEQQIWYDELLASIDAYDEQKDALDENIQKLLDYQAAVEEATKALTDEVIDARQQIYDALVEADEKEVDELKEKYDEMAKLEENYVNAIKKSIDKERQLRDSSRKQQDLETKKRKLAVYERDTSGVYSQQAEKLRAEIATDEQSLRDEAVDKQLEKLEEQISLVKEQRDMQIKRMQDFIAFKQENGVYWQQVDSKIAEGAASVNSLLLSTEAFHTADPLKQQEMMTQAQNTSTKLQTILDSGGAIAGGNVVQTLQNGIKSTVNGTVGVAHEVANYETQSLSAVKSAGDEARLAKLELQAANRKLNSSNSKLDALVAKPVAGASSTYIDNSSRSTTNYVPVLNVASVAPNSGTWNWSPTIGSTGGWVNSVTGEYKYMPYAEGGVVDYTGPAMVHGSEQRPEAFLSADQTALFAGLRDVLEGINMNNLPLQKDSSSATNIGDININLANRPSASAQDIGTEVKKALVDVLSGRNTPAITRVRQ